MDQAEDVVRMGKKIQDESRKNFPAVPVVVAWWPGGWWLVAGGWWPRPGFSDYISYMLGITTSAALPVNRGEMEYPEHASKASVSKG